MVRATISSGDIVDGVPIALGNPNGIIIEAPGEPTVYHMGDTDIFSDMALIAELPPAQDRDGADRRPLHHGRGDCSARVKRYFTLDAVIRATNGTFPMIAAGCQRLPRGDEGPCDEGDRPGKGVAGLA